MNIGIIIHSYTGNTLSVGEKLAEALSDRGHTVHIERVTAVNEDPQSKEIMRLKDIPDAAAYDAVFLGAPVHGFQLSKAMRLYLEQLPELLGKRVSCFVTQGLRRRWMGSDRAIKQFTRAVGQKGAKLIDTGIIQWSDEARDQKISELVGVLSRI